MKKVTIIALHLGYGGIEKAITDLANELCHFCDVEIVSTYKLYNKPAYSLNENIKISYLLSDLKPNKSEFIYSVKHFKFITSFKEAIKAIKILKLKKKKIVNFLKKCSSDVIISTREYHNKILSKYGSKSAIKIGWEHNHHCNNKKYFNKVVSSVKNLDKFVLISQELYNDYSKALKGYKCKCVYIPNMISIDKTVLSDLKSNNLITVSRLSVEKGIFDLVDVIDYVKKSISTIKLNLIGDGPLSDKIKEYISSKNLDHNIIMHGFLSSDEVYKHLKNSSLYVMTSFTESFGICILEAFNFGVPAIAFDSAQGAKEIINKDNGFLIKNRDKKMMAKQIVDYLNNAELRKKLSLGTQNIIDNYRSKKVIEIWKQIIE